MRTIKSDAPLLLAAAHQLKLANAALAKAKKSGDRAKEILTAWLKDERSLDLNTLLIGDIVNIDGICLIEIASQNRFDETAFATMHPEIHASFKTEKPVRKFKPLC